MYINSIEEIIDKELVANRSNTGKKVFKKIRKQTNERKKKVSVNHKYFHSKYKFIGNFSENPIFEMPLEISENNESSITTHYNIKYLQNSLLYSNLDSSPDNLEIYYHETINKNENNQTNFHSKRRKFSKDSINKKIKRLFLLFVQEKFFAVMKTHPPEIPTLVICDVSIVFNKEILNSSVKLFYEKYCSFNTSSNNDDTSLFLNKRLKDLYQTYLDEKIKADLQILCNKETLEYSSKVEENAHNFINYYMSMKPYRESKASSGYNKI